MARPSVFGLSLAGILNNFSRNVIYEKMYPLFKLKANDKWLNSRKYACRIFAMQTIHLLIDEKFNNHNKCTEREREGREKRPTKNNKLYETFIRKTCFDFHNDKKWHKATVQRYRTSRMKWYVGWPHGIYVPFAYFMMCYLGELLKGERETVCVRGFFLVIGRIL